MATTQRNAVPISPTTPIFTASTSNISKDSLDCGIKLLGWCRSEKCQRLAKLRYFLPVFLFAGLLQGAVETYFRISTKQTTTYHNDYDPQLIDWLLVSKNIFQALLAFVIAFWSQKYHPISWLGSSIIFQSVFCIFAIIPTLTHYNFDITSVKYDNFTSICKTSVPSNSNLVNDSTDYYTTKIVTLFLLQFGHAIGYVALITIGLPYTDNNANIEDAPAIFGTVFAVHAWGSLLGSVITFIADVGYMNWWFGWAIFAPLLFVSGIVIIIFPRKLLRVVLKQAAQRIIDGNSTAPTMFQFLADVNFIPSLRRLLTNKILLLNLSGLTLLKTGIFNYDANDQNYLQSRFYFPTDENNGMLDEWTSRLISYLLEPPVVGTCALVTGLLISRLKPSARCLTIWNIISGSVIVAIFISYIFIDCSSSHTLVGVRKNVVTQPYCSKECICSTKDILFMPVCVSKQTYFSPCHAGCRDEMSLNDVTIYENCTCGSNSNNNGYQPGSVLNRATQGACNMKECQVKWIIFQILSVIVAALYGTMLICKIVLILRSVLDQDKPLALALELFISGIIVYVPGKFIYDTVQRNTCAFWSLNYKKCLLQDPELYGNILNIVTMLLIGIALILDILAYIYSEDLDLFTRNPPYDEEPLHFTPPQITSPDRNTTSENVNNNNDQSSPSLPPPSSMSDEHDNINENTPMLQVVELNIPQMQQHSESSSPIRHRLLLLPPHPRPISPSTSSESQASPQISSFRHQGAIPKVLAQRQPRVQTSETDF